MHVIVVLAFLGTALAEPRSISRIIGGSDATVQEYPFMGNMQRALTPGWWVQDCGGSLITTTTTLSAAHCFYGESTSVWRVLLGTSQAASGGSTHNVQQLVLHSDFDPISLNSDIAIVRLSTPATLSSEVALGRVAGPAYILSDNTVVTAIGYGNLDDSGTTADQLQKVDVNIINQDLCAERYAYLKTQPGYFSWPDVTPGMMCTGILNVGGKDACQGDAGSPLVHAGDVVVGIHSWGYKCGDSFYPGVSTRVSYYADWIIANGSG